MDQNHFKGKGLGEELKAHFGSDNILRWVSLLYSMASRFYNALNLQGKVYFDEVIFSDCLVDFLVGLMRLDEFHEIRQPSYEKVLAYASSWIVRRKPFQMLQDFQLNGDVQRYKYINEKFSLFLLLRGAGFTLNAANETKDDLVNRVLYHLTYRDTSPKVLELFLYGVSLGKR